MDLDTLGIKISQILEANKTTPTFTIRINEKDRSNVLYNVTLLATNKEARELMKSIAFELSDKPNIFITDRNQIIVSCEGKAPEETAKAISRMFYEYLTDKAIVKIL